MNNILAYILGALLLMALYHWHNGQTLRNIPGEITEDASDLLKKVSGKAKKLTGSAKNLVGGIFDDESTDSEAGEEAAAPAAHAAPQAPHGAVNIPMGDAHRAGYPSGVLPGKVGTFHPTKDCDRFICNGCLSCGGAPASCGCAMTDDRGRNYPALIDSIRTSRTNEYPFYKLN